LRRVYIPKEDGKQRSISIPALKDKVVQKAVVDLITGEKLHEAFRALRKGAGTGVDGVTPRHHAKRGPRHGPTRMPNLKIRRRLRMTKELRTVLDESGTPLLEIVKENNAVVIYEADNMDRQIQFPVSGIPALLDQLQHLK
jgi:hypothetical protein